MCRINCWLITRTLIALAFCNVLSNAQIRQAARAAISLDVHGQVRFAEGGAPAANILVKLESYESGGPLVEVFTDRSGKFRFSGLAPAQYIVRVHHSGYVDTQQQVDLQTSSSGYVFLQLVRQPDSNSQSVLRMGVVDANVPAGAQKEFDKALIALATGTKEGIAEAVPHLEHAITLYPGFVEARLKLGTAFMDLEQWERAESTLRATLQIEPRAANALFALGETYLQQNRIDDAENVLLQGLQIDDTSCLGHLNLARVYWERARKINELTQAKPLLEKSYQEVRRGIELNSNLGAAHLLKGNLLLRASRTTDALKEFDEYLRLEPAGHFADETRALQERIRKATAQHVAR